jgi:signal transduction histidine kinase
MLEPNKALDAQQAAIARERDQALARAEQLDQALVEERERFLHIQVAIRQMVDQPDMVANLMNVAEALQALGWRRVVVALFAEDGSIDRLVVVGVEPEDQQRYRLQVVPPEIWARYLEGALESWGGLYFAPVGDAHDPTWDARDALFAPLRIGQEPASGVIRIEDPVDGRRPTRDSVRPVDILASQAAYVVENARLLETAAKTAESLADQVEELSMMHRADRELSSHLDVDRVMWLTMDWALRRTGADTGLLMLLTKDRQGLVPSVKIGPVDPDQFTYDEQHPWPLTHGIMGRAARTGETQLAPDVTSDKDYAEFVPGARAQISVPLSMRGEALGVITLASTREGAFNENDAQFLERLGRRAAVALDNARLFRQAEQLGDDMALLYSASRTITSTLERDESLQRIAQAMTVALECSSAVIFDYLPEHQQVQVLAVYRLGTARDLRETLPEIKHTIPLATFPAFQTAVEQQHPLVLRAADPAIAEMDRRHLLEDQIAAMLLVPLVAQDELMGLAVLIEGRRDRIFSANDVFKAETLASQASVALRQALLYGEVLELEKLKTEMIRMASHDLRNPLNNIMGYTELVAMSLETSGMTPDQEQYINNLRRAARAMRSLLEDLLTLERIESERQSEWQTFDLGGLATEVVEAQRSSADLKGQTLILSLADGAPPVLGSETQLRQAMANLVGNAIKYTPDGGRVEARFQHGNGRLEFTVEDNGYGISPERQARLFERFYRAQEPGTDHIGGTGLGLSLVKTVIERHGGQVWFKSEPGAGSLFGFWVPAADQK